MDFVLLLVIGAVSAVIVGIVCTCFCLAGLRMCSSTKSNVRPSTHGERRETEAPASLFEETGIVGDETVYNQYLTASVHHAMQDTLTALTNEGPLDRQTEDLYVHILESTSRYVLQNFEIHETHLMLRGTDTDTATSDVNDHSESHNQACGGIDDRVPQATVSRRGLEVSVTSSGADDATLQASGGGSSSLVPPESNEVPLESSRGGTRESQESRIGNFYQSLENRETIGGSRTGTSLHGPGSVAEIEIHGSADAGDTDESTCCQGLDASIQKAVRDYFNRPITDIVRGVKSPSGADINTEPSSDIDHAVHDYLTNIINKIKLQWLNEPSTESGSDKEYVTMQNSVTTPQDSSRHCHLNSERKVLVRELPDTSQLAARLSAIRKLPFTFESRKRGFDERNRSRYVNVKGVKKRH